MQGTGQLWVYYWMGLSFNNVTNQWTWTDGGTAGNGAVKNSNPCEQLPNCAAYGPTLTLFTMPW
jgi:hypothetical protein